MGEMFNAEIVARSELDRTNARLEISLCDTAGNVRTISLGSRAMTALASLLSDHLRNSERDVTKLPENFAVGHGRHEPVVMVRFEDDPAYGLTAEQAFGLGEALIEEAEIIASKVKYPARQ